jgi:hypothetical protein
MELRIWSNDDSKFTDEENFANYTEIAEFIARRFYQNIEWEVADENA